MIRCLATLALTSLLLAGCGVKPPLRYVAPDDSLHDVTFQPRTPGGKAGEGEAGAEAIGPDRGMIEPPPRRSREDVARDHYATAVGLQAACRHDEALAHFRGYLAAHPDGEFAAGAMLHMAEIHLDAAYSGRDVEQARALLAEVIARFGDSASAAIAHELLAAL